MDGKHAAVEGLELAGFLRSYAVLDRGEVEVAFSVVNAFTLSTKTLEGTSTGLIGLIGEAKGIASRGDVLLLDEADLLFLKRC